MDNKEISHMGTLIANSIFFSQFNIDDSMQAMHINLLRGWKFGKTNIRVEKK